MAAPLLELYDTDDTTPAASLDLGEVAEGAVTAGATYHLWNHKGAAGHDTAQDVYVTVLERPNPTGGDPDPDWHQSGQVALNGWVEVRVTGAATAGLPAQTTDYQPVGANRRLAVSDIPSNSYRAIQWRLNVPEGVASEAVEIRIVVGFGLDVLPTSEGFDGARLRGVASGVGEDGAAMLVSGLDMSEDATPDNTVTVSDGVWIHDGIPIVKLTHSITFSNQDGSSQALASGEEYLATVSAGSSSTLTVTKSNKGTAPLPDSDRPAVPAGETLVGYVIVPYDATINNAEIDQSLRLYGRFEAVYSSAALTVTIHPGLLVADNRRVRLTGSRSVTLSASSTERVWLAPDGSIEAVADGSAPTVEGSYDLWKFTTDGSGVTAAVDLRELLDVNAAWMEFSIQGTLTVGDKATAVYRGRRTGYVSFPEPIVFHLLDAGTGTGQTRLGVAVGGTTVFTSSGTDDRRPEIASAAGTPEDRAAFPEVLAIAPGELVEVEVLTVPGTTPSADLAVLLRVHGG